MQSNGKYDRVYNTRIPVKLGEGAINKGFIADAAFERGVNALVTFNLIIKEYLVEKVLAFATSAVRDASNSTQFVDTVRERAGIEINVIDGNKEAILIYLGCKQALPLNEKVSLIMDIGGGSTEFILADKDGVKWKQSFNIGAARLLQRFEPQSPISENEISSINSYLKENLAPVFEAIKQFPPAELLGSSGAFDSVVEMINGELGGEPLNVYKTGYEIQIADYHNISAKVKNTSLEERKQIKGLTPMRFDMIVISCLLIDFVLNKFNLNKIRVSTYSLKEGALVDFMNSENA